jgi:hypothetical protein
MSIFTPAALVIVTLAFMPVTVAAQSVSSELKGLEDAATSGQVTRTGVANVQPTSTSLATAVRVEAHRLAAQQNQVASQRDSLRNGYRYGRHYRYAAGTCHECGMGSVQ